MSAPRRRRSKSSRGADAAFSYLIPGFFVVLAGYQQITQGAIDKYVIGSLMIFGLGALGWRLDVFFDTWVKAKYGQNNEENKP